MPSINIGLWNIERAGLGRGQKVAKFILDWMGIATPTLPLSVPTTASSPFTFGSPGSRPLTGFVSGGYLTSQSTFGLNSSSTDDVSRYSTVTAKSALTDHGVALAGNRADVVFLQEVKGELSETLKLLSDHGGGGLEINHPESLTGECGLAVVWRTGTARSWTVTRAAYRDLVGISVNGTNFFCFGAHAKSGGSHDTQTDVARSLMAAQRELLASGQHSFIAALVGDMNTEPSWSDQGSTAVRTMNVTHNGAQLTWQAVSPGITTHGDRTLDYMWLAWREAREFNVTPANPVNVGGFNFGNVSKLDELSDHRPVGFNVDIRGLTVL